MMFVIFANLADTLTHFGILANHEIMPHITICKYVIITDGTILAYYILFAQNPFWQVQKRNYVESCDLDRKKQGVGLRE